MSTELVESRRVRPARRRRTRMPLALTAVVLALPSVLLLERAWDRRWMTDDGFINLRVVRMVLDGHGPVFNVGERVEVTTSTLWLWVLVAGDLVLPLRLEWVAVGLGLVFAVTGLAFATFGAARLHRAAGATGVVVPAGALVLAVLSPVWDFSTSGLEGGLVFGWLGLTGWLLGRWAGTDARLGAAAAVVVGLGPLVRPDLAIVSGVVLVGVLAAGWDDDTWRDRVRVVALAVALPVAYEVFRMGYYASLVPNTAFAKSGGRSRWGTGFAYLRDLVQPYWLVVPVVLLVAAVLVPAVVRAWRMGQRRIVVGLTALPVAGLVEMVYVVRVGGDYMHGRLLLPALFALMAPVAAVPVPRLRRDTATVDAATVGAPAPASGRVQFATAGVVAITLVWSLVCLAWLRPPMTSSVDGLFSADARANNVAQFGEHAVTTDDQGWGEGSPITRPPPEGTVSTGEQLIAVDAPPGLRTPAYAGYGIGIGGYVYGADVTVIDLLGLADPIVGRFQVDEPGSTGHEKPMPHAWLAARISTTPVDPAALSAPALTRPLHTSAPGEFDADTAAGGAAVECGDLRDLLAAVREPMTPGRFLSNLAAAPRFTALAVPPDPAEAERRFCGP